MLPGISRGNPRRGFLCRCIWGATQGLRRCLSLIAAGPFSHSLRNITVWVFQYWEVLYFPDRRMCVCLVGTDLSKAGHQLVDRAETVVLACVMLHVMYRSNERYIARLGIPLPKLEAASGYQGSWLHAP